jgi:hypothetical protein
MRTKWQAGSSAVLALLLCGGATPAAEKTPQVELGLQCLAAANGPELRVALKNTGTGDANVVFGITLGNGRTYHASALVLEVKRRDGDAIESFQTADSSYSVAGRLDPWIVPLPVGSEFSITRPIGVFRSPDNTPLSISGSMELRVKVISRRENRPRGDDAVGPGLVHVLPGDLQSAWISVPESCR